MALITTGEGPDLAHLMNRLAACPPIFLEAPVGTPHGKIHTAAVVSDIIRRIGGPFLSEREARRLTERKANAGRVLRLTQVAAWVLADDWFKGKSRYQKKARELLTGRLAALARVLPPDSVIDDMDRREELVRVILAALDLRPAGESEAAAVDRLAALDSGSRIKLAKEAAEAEARARKVREAMARKAAQEAANNWGRE